MRDAVINSRSQFRRNVAFAFYGFDMYKDRLSIVFGNGEYFGHSVYIMTIHRSHIIKPKRFKNITVVYHAFQRFLQFERQCIKSVSDQRYFDQKAFDAVFELKIVPSCSDSTQMLRQCTPVFRNRHFIIV